MHGVYPGEVSHDGEHLIVDGVKIKVRWTQLGRMTPWMDRCMRLSPYMPAILRTYGHCSVRFSVVLQ